MIPSNPNDELHQINNNQESSDELKEIKLRLFLSEQENDKLKRILEQKNAEIEHTKFRLQESNERHHREMKKHRDEIDHYKKGIRERDDKFEAREAQIKKKDGQLNGIVATDCISTLGTCCLIS